MAGFKQYEESGIGPLQDGKVAIFLKEPGGAKAVAVVEVTIERLLEWGEEVAANQGEDP